MHRRLVGLDEVADMIIEQLLITEKHQCSNLLASAVAWGNHNREGLT